MSDHNPRGRRGFLLPGMKPKTRPSKGPLSYSHRLPFLDMLPDRIRNHFIAMSGEFTGTFLFLFFAFSGTQVGNTKAAGATLADAPDPSQLLYIALCFGFSLAVNAWVFFRISGGLFNPAVSLGMCLVGAMPWVRGGLIVISQLLGSISAAAVVAALFPGPLNVRTALGGGTTVTQGLFIEMFLTAELVFTIFMLAAEKHKATFIAPVGIGLSLFIAELTGVYYTGGSLNPARSFGPCVVLHSFYSYHWIYWVGPFLGTLLASGFYVFIKMLEYETANPGQDKDEHTIELEVDTSPVVASDNLMTEDAKDLSDGHTRTASGGASTFISTDGQLVDERKLPSSNGLENPEMSTVGKSTGLPTYPPVPGASNFEGTHQDPSLAFNAGPATEAGRYVARSAGRP